MSFRAPEAIGSNLQLFMDDHWISTSDGARRRLHPAVKRNAAILPENPWEMGYVGGMSTVKDGNIYKAWYTCDDASIFDNPKISWFRKTAYAESLDGITWVKPHVGLHEFEGSKDNNLVWMGPSGVLGVFLDTNPDAKEEERFKAVGIRYEGKEMVVVALGSHDGKDWRVMQDPILTEGPFDTMNIPFWDEVRGEYVIYTRAVAGEGSFIGGVRWIRRTTSKDFCNWTGFEAITAGDTPFEHLYTSACVPYERAPGTYLMFPSRYVPERTPDPDWYGGKGVSDIVFMSSRDGINFDRSFMEAFVRPGPDKSNWHERAIYMERGIHQTSPTEISLYGMEGLRTRSVNVRRYTVRTDGFVSVNAGASGGEFTTHTMTFTEGSLELNFSTSAVGSVRVEIQDADGVALPKFAMADCPDHFGDDIEGGVSWHGGGDLSGLAGKPIRLRFALKDADLYAFRFRE